MTISWNGFGPPDRGIPPDPRLVDFEHIDWGAASPDYSETRRRGKGGGKSAFLYGNVFCYTILYERIAIPARATHPAERGPMIGSRFLDLYEKAVNALSFSEQLYRLRRELNTKIDIPDTVEPPPRASDSVVTRWFKRRRISIAEAYLRVVRDLESRHSRSRLRALRMMLDVSFHAKTLAMPLNTARVQMALIKEAVKSRHDRRRQLELLHDFSRSSYGQSQVIRKLCDELNIVELPETGALLRDLDMGFDFHVHDTATSGRKNPTQLLIDAFIKGISELTIAYGGFFSKDLMEEALEAGRIVGIKVNIALELSVLVQDRRFHFLVLLPELRKAKDLEKFLDAHRGDLKKISEGLEKNQENRVEAVKRLLKHFNHTSLVELNEGWPDDPLYRIDELKLKDLAELVPRESLNRMHLGEFLYGAYKGVLFNRLLYLKVRREGARRDLKAGYLSGWDYRIIEKKYEAVREEYRTLSPEGLRLRYFTDVAAGEYSTSFDDLHKVRSWVKEAGCSLRIIHPLEHGLDAAIALLDRYGDLLDQVEVYNLKDGAERDPEHILRLARHVNELNRRAERDGKRALVPVCGSDSTGRSPRIPGMGFIREEKLFGRNRRKYAGKHIALPPFIAAMIRAGGKAVDEAASVPAGTKVPAGTAENGRGIICMGKISEGNVNLVGDEKLAVSERIPLGRALRYLNPALVDLVYAGIGFLVAYRFIGLGYALLWFGITGFRTTVADLVADRGARIDQWKLSNVNFDNVARALFWTGFSVPILGFVKSRFDVVWPFAATGALYAASKFFFISMANGLYLATHNTLRGFDRKVVRANFFRSVLAWPLVTVFSPLGDLAGLPSIVQTKLWSDFVAGIIEGGNKYLTILKLRMRDIGEIIPRILKGDQNEACVAILDLLYLYREEPRTVGSLESLFNPRSLSGGLLKAGAEDKEDTYGTLRSVVDDEELGRRMLDYVLANHERETAVDLSNLIAFTLPQFRSWLASQEAAVVRAGAKARPSSDEKKG
jgi:predicted metal-dependent phosphoesterase TrpH